MLQKRVSAILYAIVNNAGIANPGDFAWFRNVDIFEKVMNVNFMGQVRVTQALLPLLLQTSVVHGGRILNLSSVCGTAATAGNSSYNASKFAVEGWSDSLRLELAPMGIAVVKVRPGQISTQIQTDWVDNYLKNYQQAPAYIRELYGGDAYSDRVAEFFASTQASNNLTGPSLVVEALEDMLSMEQHRLQPDYWLGSDAHTFWRAMHTLPAQVADGFKSIISPFRIAPPERPPPNVICHLTITVRNLEISMAFYTAFGMETYGDSVNGQRFLRFSGKINSAHPSWPTLILLREDPSMPPRGKSADAGMTRLCLLTTNLFPEMERLERDHGIKPMGPIAFDASGVMISEYLAAYKDPDGFVVYMVEMQRLMGWFIRSNLWWYRMKTPSLFHWTVNVTNSRKALKIFEELGFVSALDLNRDGVIEDLLPAFNMDPASTVIEHIRLCMLPKDSVFATIMEWVEPRSVIQPHSATNALAITVDDVDTAMAKAESIGMVVGKREYRQMPVFGSVLVGTAYVEDNSCPVEFCCFTNKDISA